MNEESGDSEYEPSDDDSEAEDDIVPLNLSEAIVGKLQIHL